jgi:AraC family transcriptional regulator
MEYRIEILVEKKLVGMRLEMTFNANRTGEIWHSFMPRRKEVQNVIGSELYSVQIYSPLFFNNFNADSTFEKWAAVQVSGFEIVPPKMETLTLPAGLYVVFLYKGAASEAANTFQYIFGTWLPKSGYILNDRPHFEKLGEKYKNDDPGSEEEIWIPIKPGE